MEGHGPAKLRAPRDAWKIFKECQHEALKAQKTVRMSGADRETLILARWEQLSAEEKKPWYEAAEAEAERNRSMRRERKRKEEGEEEERGRSGMSAPVGNEGKEVQDGEHAEVKQEELRATQPEQEQRKQQQRKSEKRKKKHKVVDTEGSNNSNNGATTSMSDNHEVDEVIVVNIVLEDN